ncbi:MAG TPA: hydroxymethylbilane synthase, partial [Coxiellaceae bacterium]|nr:hydroxymethylbilane synthase [Coxiellaceae bacterium]
AALQKEHPHLKITLIPMTTEGDEAQSESLKNKGGKSLFVKALQEALLTKKADIAVHSIKDMSVQETKGLMLAAVCAREDARDAFISKKYHYLSDLPKNAILGTASPRRESLVRAIRPDLHIKLLRGNIDTRLKKLDNDEYDAIILATAGLNRLGLRARIQSHFSVETFTPAIGQGAMGVECRSDDIAIKKIVQCLHHEPTALCVAAERAVNQVLKGDCHSPIGAYAYIAHAQLHLHAMVGSLDGKIILNTYQCGDVSDAVMLGELAAKQLLKDGAATLLRE